MVAFDGSRNWICRLSVHPKKSKYIEFPNGGRYELNGVEDIKKFKDQLMNAYSESGLKGNTRPLFPMDGRGPSGFGVSPVKGRDDVNNFSRN